MPVLSCSASKRAEMSIKIREDEDPLNSKTEEPPQIIEGGGLTDERVNKENDALRIVRDQIKSLQEEEARLEKRNGRQPERFTTICDSGLPVTQAYSMPDPKVLLATQVPDVP
ncbi:hypothetical protein CDL15_Pgr023638 [Punica granatum]|uniref:Uncharacterized protein n=1 Tax=Punica granatum TaxID=22663 RepID=A0A218W802_PUNGR|nr:hypothetical protein CDL15_Pgr023638 [Punica granatum]